MKKLLSTFLILTIFTLGITNAQINENSFFSYLQKSFTNKTSDENEFLVKQFEIFLNTFPSSSHGDECYYYLGQIKIEERDYFDALSCYVKIRYLYPKSSRLVDAKNAWTQIVNDHESRSFEGIAKEFLSNLNDIKPANDLMTAYFEYLLLMHESKVEDYNRILLSDINYYLLNFATKVQNTDQCLFWLGEIYEKQRDWDESLLSYKKLLELTPQSSLIPQTLFRIAYLQYSEKSEAKKAKESFVQLITSYSENDAAGDAQFYLAELFDKELDDKKEAIANYRLVVETYPKNKHSVEALKRVAEILEKDDKYEEAIASYYQIVELYPDDPFAPGALMEIKDLYLRKLKNYDKAIETLKFYAKQYSQKEDAAEMLFDAADIYEDDLKNKQAAIDTYNQVRNDFPGTKYAEKAKDRIESLSEK